MSEQTTAPHVYTAILAVMRDIGTTGIEKSRNNRAQGFMFRGIDDVLNALNPLYVAHQLLVLPRVQTHRTEQRTSKDGKPLYFAFVEVEFDFISVIDGSRHVVRTAGEALDSADKATNKAMSAAYKYAAIQAFSIPTEGDNDADATTHELQDRQHGHAAPAPTAPAPPPPVAKAVLEELFQRMAQAPDRKALDAAKVEGKTLCEAAEDRDSYAQVLAQHRAHVTRLAAPAARKA